MAVTPSRNGGPRKMNGKILMLNGREISGVITVSMNQAVDEKGYLRFKANGRNETSRVNIKDLKGFIGNGVYYEPRRAENIGIGRPPLYFMRRLTPDSSRIHLFIAEIESADMTNNGITGPTLELERDYFMVLPQQTEKYAAVNLRGRKLAPNFDEKMSGYVKDCPALAEKIKQKQKGYFYNDIAATPRRVDVMMNIIDEYNGCK
jgi:hypothetical protein